MAKIIVDRDWVDAIGREASTAPLLMDTEFWVRAFFEEEDVIRWMDEVGAGRLIVSHTTIRELAFSAHWHTPGVRPDPEFHATLLEFADALPRRYPYLPLLEPALISTIEHVRADPRLKELWITKADGRLPLSPGRLEMTGASIHLGLAIVTRVNSAYLRIAGCGYRIPRVFDPITGDVVIVDGKVVGRTAG